MQDTIHYSVNRAYGDGFEGWLDVDPTDPFEILARLHVRKILPFEPELLYVVENERKEGCLQIRVRSNDCVALNLTPCSYGSVQPEAAEAQDEEDDAVEKYIDEQHRRATDEVRFLLNELKAIEEAHDQGELGLRDRRAVRRRLDWLSVYFDNGGPSPGVKFLIGEAAKLPVQA